MIKYEKVVGQYDNVTIIRYNEDGSQSAIPTDPANSDYQAYLAWKENEETK